MDKKGRYMILKQEEIDFIFDLYQDSYSDNARQDKNEPITEKHDAAQSVVTFKNNMFDLKAV